MSKKLTKMGIVGFLSLACTLFVVMPVQAEIMIGEDAWNWVAGANGSGASSSYGVVGTRVDADAKEYEVFKDWNTGRNAEGDFAQVTLNSSYEPAVGRVAMSLQASSEELFNELLGALTFNGTANTAENPIYTTPENNGNGWDSAYFFYGLESYLDEWDTFVIDFLGYTPEENDIYTLAMYISEVPVHTEPGPGAPEPATLAMFGLGLAGLGMVTRRRMKK